jgi:type VI protein secretion system component VasF
MWCLLTNFPRNQVWTKSCILDLYHQRWGIETFFRELKGFLGAGHFHAQTIEGIRQDLRLHEVQPRLTAGGNGSILTPL